MATLSATELQAVRNATAVTQVVNYTKATINAAAQAVETFLVGQAAAISSAIDTATSPVALSNAQKKKIVAEVIELKFQRDK